MKPVLRASLTAICFFSFVFAFGHLSSTSAHAVSLETVQTGFSEPVFVTFAPGDSTRLFVVEQGGRIKIIKDGSLLSEPFLDIDSIVLSGGERGLLGLAFHLNYQSNGRFFVNYTDNGGETHVSEYAVTSNPDSADADSRSDILFIDQTYANHNGGMIAFSPIDGYLYIGTGDGGSSGDPDNAGQTPTTLLGKMLRIDIDGGTPYAIPSDNPWASAVDTLPEIWSFGLRNPWRYSFDRETGDLYIGDVGQGVREEVSFEAAGGDGGINYGWRLKEGFECFSPSTNCDTAGVLTDPIFQYVHTFSSPGRCSITGGYVYRGCAIPELQGKYFFSDYCTGEVWSFRYDGSNISDSVDHSPDLDIGDWTMFSFGEDYFGEMYLVAGYGTIFKMIPDGPPAACEPCCVWRGDINGVDNGPDITDLVYLVGYMFSGGPAPPCLEHADVNGSGGNPDIADLVYIVAFMFSGGPAPVACP